MQHLSQLHILIDSLLYFVIFCIDVTFIHKFIRCPTCLGKLSFNQLVSYSYLRNCGMLRWLAKFTIKIAPIRDWTYLHFYTPLYLKYLHFEYPRKTYLRNIKDYNYALNMFALNLLDHENIFLPEPYIRVCNKHIPMLWVKRPLVSPGNLIIK